MQTATIIANQLDSYVKGEPTGHNGKALKMDQTRLQAGAGADGARAVNDRD